MERGKRGSGKPVSGRRKPGRDTKRPYSIKKEGDYKSKDRAEKTDRPYTRGNDEKPARPYTRKEGENTERKRFDKPEKNFGRSNDESRERPRRERSDKPEFSKDKGAREVRRKRINRDGTPAREDHRKKRYDEPRPRRDTDRPYRDKKEDDRTERKPYEKSDKPYTRRDDEKSDRPYRDKKEDDRTERKPHEKSDKPYTRRDDEKSDRPYTRRKEDDRTERKSYGKPEKTFTRRDDAKPDRPYRERKDDADTRKPRPERDSSFSRDDHKRNPRTGDHAPHRDGDRPYHKKEDRNKNFSKSRRPEKPKARGGESRERPFKESVEGVRLNKFIANAGICSRREADAMIESGVVTINDVVITQLGTRVKSGDVVKYGGQTLRGERLRYILLNKPKGFITTTDDPHSRDTVMQLVAEACKERIYPVGRLDRNTSGLLLFTNDGELAKKLTHPRYRVEKIYHVELDRGLTAADMNTIAEGMELDDGPVKVDDIAYTGDSNSKKKIGIVIHSGRNRIVRRIFEQLDYSVVKLDRTVFAGLTKKDLPRAAWRHLTEEEVNILRRIR